MVHRLAAAAIVLLAACTSSSAYTLPLTTLNDSGVTGEVHLTDLGDGTTRVVVDVEPAGHPSMPAHVHPGTCDELVPQPRHPLEQVVDGQSETIVPASLEELLAGDLAINLHSSSEDMGTYTACVELN